MAQAHRFSEAILQDIVQRIVDVAQPERIILFGSAARGEMGPHSDVDVLVVTPEQLEQYRDRHCLVIAPALREGKEVYHAHTVPTR